MWTQRDPHRFVVGANLPWVGYGIDFGASAWYPAGGLSAQSDALERLNRTFATLDQDGLRVVRVFVLCDGRSGIRYDRDGLPSGLDDAVFPDFEALLIAARRSNVRLMPVLLDFHLCSPARVVGGVQLGGRAHLIADPNGRSALVDNVLGPFAERYGSDDRVIAWDIMNEPEWCLRRLRVSWSRADRFRMLQQFLGLAVRRVQSCARQPVTIGCAGTWQLDLVTPLGLDFYQVHWYERFGWQALARRVDDLGLNRPVVLGEFAGRSARVSSVLEAAQSAGYEGAFVWSVLSDDEHSAYSPDVAAWVRASGGGGRA
jgi:hypothetical protein